MLAYPLLCFQAGLPERHHGFPVLNELAFQFQAEASKVVADNLKHFLDSALSTHVIVYLLQPGDLALLCPIQKKGDGIDTETYGQSKNGNYGKNRPFLLSSYDYITRMMGEGGDIGELIHV
jgi:hypothetical protein